MIRFSLLKQIGNTKLFDIKLSEKDNFKIYVTLQEIEDMLFYYKSQDKEVKISQDGNMDQIPTQGLLFIILNNVMDWRKVNSNIIKECLNLDQEDELYLINKILFDKILNYQDGLINETQQIKSDNKFINIQKDTLLFQLYSQNQNYEESLEVILKLIGELEKQKENTNVFQFYLFNSYINSSSLLSLHGRREEALENLNKANSLLKKLFLAEELIFYKAVVQMNIANIDQDLFNFESVQNILNKCLKDLDKIKDALPYRVPRLMAQVHNNLSTCYQQEGDEQLDKSLEHSLISLQMNEVYFGNQMNTEIAKNLMNISSIYKDLEMLDEAITYSLRAELIFSQLQDRENLPICLGMIASIYAEETIHNYPKAIEYSEKCVKQLEAYGKKNTIDYAVALHSLSTINNKHGKSEEALNYAQASLKLFQEMKEEHGQLQCFELISKIYKSLNNLDLTIDYLYDAIQIREKLEKDHPTEELFLAYQSIAVMWEEKGDTQESNYYTNKAKKIEKKLKQYL